MTDKVRCTYCDEKLDPTDKWNIQERVYCDSCDNVKTKKYTHMMCEIYKRLEAKGYTIVDEKKEEVFELKYN